MPVEYQMLISFILERLLHFFLKAFRDIIRNRYEWSVFTNLPEWLQRWILSDESDLCSVCDGWHVADGMMSWLPPALGLYWLNRLLLGWNWWILSAGVIIAIVLYYQYFNWLYHYALMKPPYKGRRYEP